MERRRHGGSVAPRARATAFGVFAALLLLAAGFQAHFAVNSAPLYLRHAAPADLAWRMPIFRIGFNVLMFPASALV